MKNTKIITYTWSFKTWAFTILLIAIGTYFSFESAWWYHTIGNLFVFMAGAYFQESKTLTVKSS